MLGIGFNPISIAARSQGVGDRDETFAIQVPDTYGSYAAYNAAIGPVRLLSITAFTSLAGTLWDSATYNEAGMEQMLYFELADDQIQRFDPPLEFTNGLYIVMFNLGISGLPNGTEFITNGSFAANVAGWTPQLTGAAVTWNAGKLRLTAGSGQSARATQTISGLTVGQTYRIRAKYTAVAASALIRVTTSADGSGTGQIIVTDTATVGTSQNVATTFVASATSVTIALLVTFEGVADFDDISVDTLGPVAELEVAA